MWIFSHKGSTIVVRFFLESLTYSSSDLMRHYCSMMKRVFDCVYICGRCGERQAGFKSNQCRSVPQWSWKSIINGSSLTCLRRHKVLFSLYTTDLYFLYSLAVDFYHLMRVFRLLKRYWAIYIGLWSIQNLKCFPNIKNPYTVAKCKVIETKGD